MLPGHRIDPWQALRSRTAARVALGRAGTSLPTAEVLKFSLDHAEARDAVLSEADFDAVEQSLSSLDRPVIRVHSNTANRADYIRHPDRGRVLLDADRDALTKSVQGPVDCVILIGDGLSAAALQHAGPIALKIIDRLLESPTITVGPVVLVKNARVAIQDDVGQALQARSALILIGERPGLGAADSLGAYFVLAPQAGRTDADRNCVSNIRPAGLPLEAATDTIVYLIRQSLARGVSGVALKDDRTAAGPLLP